MKLGLYLHVPFCARSCDFCAFYQEAPKRSELDRYLDAIDSELASLVLPKPVDTVFWGGGTPGLLPAADLERLGRAVLEACKGTPAEWTVEMAPSTVKADKLEVLKGLGVTRISMGVQSFDESLLQSLGRLHTTAQVLKAIELVRAAGFHSLNIDLMFALPNQSLNQWEADLEKAVSLGTDHISTYCLTFEEDTALWVRLNKGQVKRQSEADEVAFYERCWDIMEAAGLHQYEVSNFARIGHECQHNLDTWHMQEWIGVGPSASSQFGGSRFTNVPDLDRWQASVFGGNIERVDEVALDDQILGADALIFGLRLNRGVDLRALAERFPGTDWALVKQFVDNLLEEGLAELSEGFLRLTRAGRLVADKVAVHLVEALDEA